MNLFLKENGCVLSNQLDMLYSVRVHFGRSKTGIERTKFENLFCSMDGRTNTGIEGRKFENLFCSMDGRSNTGIEGREFENLFCSMGGRSNTRVNLGYPYGGSVALIIKGREIDSLRRE